MLFWNLNLGPHLCCCWGTTWENFCSWKTTLSSFFPLILHDFEESLMALDSFSWTLLILKDSSQVLDKHNSSRQERRWRSHVKNHGKTNFQIFHISHLYIPSFSVLNKKKTQLDFIGIVGNSKFFPIDVLFQTFYMLHILSLVQSLAQGLESDFKNAWGKWKVQKSTVGLQPVWWRR